MRACRKKLTSQARKEAAKNILDAAAPVLEREDETIASYVPVNAEPDVMGIANEAFRQGKEVLLPRLGPKLSRTWALYRPGRPAGTRTRPSSCPVWRNTFPGRHQ